MKYVSFVKIVTEVQYCSEFGLTFSSRAFGVDSIDEPWNSVSRCNRVHAYSTRMKIISAPIITFDLCDDDGREIIRA